MSSDADVPRELAGLVVPRRGSLEATGDLFQPYRLVDGDGAVVAPVAGFFAELAACGRPATTQRSYGMDLLRWFRFLWALGVGWDQATRVEARDFCRWLQVAVKPTRPHWRHPDDDLARSGRSCPAPVNAVTGKAGRGEHYEASTVAHCVLVTWNLAAAETLSLRYDHGLRRLVGHGSVGGEVAGVGPAREGGRLASRLG
ncbi:MAG TPA: hypothetical protein VME67_02790 [Mycobacterium sp.]|nr:hypothetical protein [Mycobacterium sp.]HTX93847.1 hypothetical protein [Mycobacterium sp.]